MTYIVRALKMRWKKKRNGVIKKIIKRKMIMRMRMGKTIPLKMKFLTSKTNNS